MPSVVANTATGQAGNTVREVKRLIHDAIFSTIPSRTISTSPTKLAALSCSTKIPCTRTFELAQFTSMTLQVGCCKLLGKVRQVGFFRLSYHV